MTVREIEEPAERSRIAEGVLRELHRTGVGRTLVQAAEAWCATHGVELLQVKTLAATKEDET